jgi:hypothetical protein
MTFIAKTGIRLFPRNVDFDVSSITFYYSFLWASLPFEVVKYIIDRFDADPNLFNLYKGSFVAEESFLATLVMDSKYREWLHWEENGVSSSLTCTVGEADNHPLVIKMKDIKKVEDSGLFFARKFDERVDKEVIEYFYNKTTKG